jgi:hypothetical protein
MLTGQFAARSFIRRAVLVSATVACAAALTAAAWPDSPAPAAATKTPAAATKGAAAKQVAAAGTKAAAVATKVPGAAAPTRATAAGGTTVPGAARCPLFPADNVWNTNISKLPVDSHSAAWMASMDSASTYLHPDFGPDPGGYPYGIPVTIVTSATKRVHIRFEYASESYRGRYPFGPGTAIEGGRNATGDRHAIMVNSTTCTLYELWEARYSARGSTAGSGAMWKLTSNALRPAGWTSADAAGLPILPGLLSYSEVKAAVRTGRPITHAIRFTAAATAAAYLWPARHEAGSGSIAHLPPMGARFRLKANFRVASYCRNSQRYCRDAKAVLTEMKYYGLILADNGSNWFFQGSAYPQWPDALVTLLKGIPARDFQAVNESCLMVARNSGEARARPGCPVG